MIQNAEDCLECLESGSECEVGCATCTTNRSVCRACQLAGFTAWEHERRRCSHCQKHKKRCVRGKVYITESDKEPCNKKALLLLFTLGKIASWWPVFGIQHGVKSAVGPLFNWFLAVYDDIVCITDLLALWTQPLIALLSIITKEVLIRKDKHSTQLIYVLFGRRVSDLVSGLVVKNTIWPELYEVWKAKFLRRNLEKLNDPRGIAINEIGTLLVVDSNAVYVGKLCNPVALTRLLFNGTEVATPTHCEHSKAYLRNPHGIAFIAREVAILCDRDANEIRIIHTDPKSGNAVYNLQFHHHRGGGGYDSDESDGEFRINRPHGVATIARLDAAEPGQAPFAIVAVTEFEQSALLILVIEQDETESTAPYSATRVVRVSLVGPGVRTPHHLPLRGVTALCMRRVAISVLRARRDGALEGCSNVPQRTAIKEQFQNDSATSTLVYVTRQGVDASEPSVVLEVDVAPVITSATIPGTTHRRDGSENVSLSATVVTKLQGAAGPVAVDQNQDVYARQRPCQISQSSKSTDDGRWSTSNFAGSVDGASSQSSPPNKQPKDGEASRATFGTVAAFAAFPCGRTLFGVDSQTAQNAQSRVRPSIFKVANLDGFARWARPWNTQLGCFGERDPTRSNEEGYLETPPRLWGSMLPDLEASGRELDAIMQARLDAIGFDSAQGPLLAMDTGSLRQVVNRFQCVMAMGVVCLTRMCCCCLSGPRRKRPCHR